MHALEGYTGPGTTWGNEMNFVMKHAPGAGSIARPVKQQSCATLITVRPTPPLQYRWKKQQKKSLNITASVHSRRLVWSATSPACELPLRVHRPLQRYVRTHSIRHDCCFWLRFCMLWTGCIGEFSRPNNVTNRHGELDVERFSSLPWCCKHIVVRVWRNSTQLLKLRSMRDILFDIDI